MEIDSSPGCSVSAYCHRMMQSLSRVGVPENISSQGPRALVDFVKSKSVRVVELVYAILPTDDDEIDKDMMQESLTWLQWLMFKDDPEVVLEHLVEICSNERGVCGAVWGNNDIAYRCRTCEHDPTCAICVPCFENGNHKDHDYSIIYTGGGCCDCGDITAWKREGFCSKHKGAEQIQPLPKHIEESLGPVLDVMLDYWKDKLLYADGFSDDESDSYAAKSQEALDTLALALVELLLDFCKHSESLLGFISERMYTSRRLLEILLSVEKFMNHSVVGKLHELLLKMLGDPVFKYEFAKVFVAYYPTIVNAAISEGSDSAFKKYPLLSTFSVQILTVPTLTPRLVEEMNLLDMLLQCLDKIFSSFAGEDGRLQVVKWANLYETTLRVVEDVRFVMSHSVVPRYICNHRRDLLKMWMKLLASVQGMNTLKRETGNHVDDENENIHLPFVLCHSISNILNLLVGGAFSRNGDNDTSEETFFRTCNVDCEDQDNMRHAKVGRLSHESSVGSSTGKSTLDHESRAADSSPIPPSASWLLYECLKSIENWLSSDNNTGPNSMLAFKTSNGTGNNFLALKRTLSNFRRGRYLLRSSSAHGRPTILSEDLNKQPVTSDDNYTKSVLGLLEWGQPPNDDNHLVEGESSGEIEGLRILSSQEWPDITYDVSTQEISVHIPLHRMLSVALHRALKDCYGNTQSSSFALSSNLADPSYMDRHAEFFGQILDGCHPNGFSSFLMEHPLRIRVFCAEVHAGMWRRNGDAPILFREWYRSVRWSEQGQELDLFLLQCCAALAPPDLYVQRLVQRFRLSNYLSLNANLSAEHDPVLMVEMLTLLIHIVKERRFCGLTNAECLERELVYKLATGDATRSQIIKSLPRDLSKADELQTVLDRVAEYSHPSGINQGTYKLRSSYWKELDLYHPRWNLRDRQAAEERYSRFCNVSALNTQLPRWTKIYYPLRGIAKVATCGTLLHIIRAVLYYAACTDEPMKSRAPDAVILTALHLLALALDVCRVHREPGDMLGNVVPVLAFANEETGSGKYGSHSLLSLLVILMRNHETEDTKHLMEAGNFSLSSLVSSLIKTFVELEPACLTKLRTLDPQLANQFSNAMLNDNAKRMDFTSDSEMRKAKSREKQAAILEKMRAQQSKFLDSIQSNGDVEMDDVQSEQDACNSEFVYDAEESPQVICSLCHDHSSKNPVSFLVLLQKSRLLSFVNQGPPSWDDPPSSSDKEHVSRNNNTVCDSCTCSNSYCSDDTTLFPHLEALVKSAVDNFASVGQSVDVNAFVEFIKNRFPTMKNTQPPFMPKDEEAKVPSLEGLEDHIFSLIRGFQSNLNVPGSPEMNARAESLLLGKYIAALPKEPAVDNLPAQNSRSSGVTPPESCGPGPGYDNFSNNGGDGVYVSSCGHAVHQACLDRYLSSLRERFTRRILFEGRHIVDPDQGEFLCPVCRGLANSVVPALPGSPRKVSLSSSGSNPSASSDIVGSLRLQDGLFLIKRAVDIAGQHENLRALPTSNVKIEPNLEPIIRILCGMYYQRHDKIVESGRVSHSLLLWDTLKYSIMSAEIAARSVKSSLNPNYSVGALYKELNSPSGFILSLLLDVVQCTRKTHSTTALLRLIGIQFFAQSFFPGSSTNELSSYSCGQDMLHILEKAEPNVRYPDTQLCRLASEPILTRDAFSSLMWLLFCLPWPMLYCKESFLSLVHVFYVVAVIQAMAICRGKGADLTLCYDGLFTDICRLTGKEAKALEFFSCHSANPAYDVNDTIRSLTYPYLRRCALLWKLIFSKLTPFGDGAHPSPGESFHDLDYSTNSLDELSEVKKLERMLNIPSLDFICNDQVTRTVASRWVAHFSEAFSRARRYEEGALKCNPAVPFKLMVLPHFYHNLLQRYIKKCCPECGAIKEEPALCLLCGRLCSPSWKTCCRESGCQTHSSVCGAGTGVFLLVRKTTILLQRSARQAPWPSPYLDAYGEEDVEMHRGKPLFLNEERYACLSYMVASHGLDRSSKVLRQTTTGAFFML